MSQTTRKKTSNSKNRKSKSSTKSVKKPQRKQVDYALKNEVLLIAILAMAVFVFLCVIPVIQGPAAVAISNAMFGMFGILAYVIPVILFLGFAFGISNKGNTVAIIKIISAVVLLFLIGILSFVFTKQMDMLVPSELVKTLYVSSKNNKSGAGVVFGLFGFLLYRLVGFWGTLFISLVLLIICVVFITEKSFLSGLKKGSKFLANAAKEERIRRKEYFDSLQEFDEDIDNNIDNEENYSETTIIKDKRNTRKKNSNEINSFSEIEVPDEEPKLRRIDKKIKGVSSITLDKNKTAANKSDIHEITIDNEDGIELEENIHILPNVNMNPVIELETTGNLAINTLSAKEDIIASMPEPVTERSFTKVKEPEISQIENNQIESTIKALNKVETEIKYKFPPINLLTKGEKGKSDSNSSLKETAYLLQQTLQNFGVNVTVTDISQGPTVTRFELQPELGVKVSKIKSLEDDIKLNLATTDIRIEAPIPGKAAVGIEVPNKENASVALRDLIESKEFKNSSANLTFAVGKDIGGQVVVTDISKMPHLLIAGATGSGKSVCINTIIMSLIYKANPNDVKMIMIDPKVVELSVYNGIPHLMIPVVTDPKKASAALQWAVNEMSDRYQKFADYNVRDLKGFNKLAENGACDDAGNVLKKMPQLVIIVDELADLMMVASNEVEESICRLAQLARAAGIHLIIATQRPSVDVITGLIKANMPSRIAFSVSSGVDSRTILDMNGAEKLLGKGDMLFYPQGYAKPSRIQGAFVSDSEVSDVVDYLKNQKLGNVYNDEITSKIESASRNSVDSSNGSSGSEFDQYFAEAGRLMIEKDKASIGMLQRAYKIGFNRAARIMDQLEGVGLVSAEEGTKPRKLLMSMEQFESVLEEIM